MVESPLLALLHVCDSLFPTGGFAHSDGLEAATTEGRVSTAADLGLWMDAVLDESLGRTDGPAVLLAWRAFTEDRREDVAMLDAEVHALRPSSTARTASRAMGARLLKTWREIHPELAADSRLPAAGARLTLPVAFGCISGAAGIDQRSAAAGFIYMRLAATISSAMRLMPIGQTDAHALLARTLARVPATLDAIDRRLERGERPGAFCPAFDVATMAQQHVRSRLFLS